VAPPPPPPQWHMIGDEYGVGRMLGQDGQAIPESMDF
jgi:hypothetical protein